MADTRGTALPPAPGPELTPDQVRRYSRHLLLPEVGREGQRRLRVARVLCVGAGGLGSPATMYLAAAGVGTLAVIDHDVVDFSNLQRQILHSSADVGRPKVESARERLRAINPEVKVEAIGRALTAANAIALLSEYDVIVDGSDNFPTRYLVNDASVLTGRPYVYGSLFRFEGQVSVFAAPGGPCYRCLYPEPPPPELVSTCAEAGVLGVVPGIVGTIQATEAIKLIVGIGEPLIGRLLILDARSMRFRDVRLDRDPGCPVCGDSPTITSLQDYDAFCGGPHAPADPGAGSPGSDVPFDVGATDLARELASGQPPLLLDVREPMEFGLNRLEGAILVPLGEISDRLGDFDRDRAYVVYCHHGIRSARAVEILRAAGLRARNLRGGITAWIDEVEPTMTRY